MARTISKYLKFSFVVSGVGVAIHLNKLVNYSISRCKWANPTLASTVELIYIWGNLFVSFPHFNLGGLFIHSWDATNQLIKIWFLLKFVFTQKYRFTHKVGIWILTQFGMEWLKRSWMPNIQMPFEYLTALPFEYRKMDAILFLYSD